MGGFTVLTVCQIYNVMGRGVYAQDSACVIQNVHPICACINMHTTEPLYKGHIGIII